MERRSFLGRLGPIVVLPLLHACGGGDDDEQLLEVRHVWRTNFAEVPSGYFVVRSRAEMVDFWLRYESIGMECNSSGACVPLHTTPDDIDFERHAVAGVCAGISTACSSVQITRLRVQGDAVTVEYRIEPGPPGQGCIASISWMVDFVLIPAGAREVRFRQLTD